MPPRNASLFDPARESSQMISQGQSKIHSSTSFETDDLIIKSKRRRKNRMLFSNLHRGDANEAKDEEVSAKETNQSKEMTCESSMGVGTAVDDMQKIQGGKILGEIKKKW